MDRYELAWAAGFFDGEGWAGRVQPKARRTGQPHARINQADDADIPAVLARFRRAVGNLGSLGGPYCKTGRRDLYRWEVSSTGDVEIVFDLLRPWLGGTKLLQFATAVARSAPNATAAAPSDEWLAWCAGLYDGEGCSALLRHRTHEGYMTGELSVTQSSLVGVPEVLHRIVATLQAGYVAGPFLQRGAKKDVYRWKVAARADVQRVLGLLWPWLSEVKRRQAQNVLDTLAAQPDLPRGNPAWGSHKTHCINGHEYASTRVRPYVPRSVGRPRRENQFCLACLREYARKQRKRERPAADDDRRSISEHSVRYLLK